MWGVSVAQNPPISGPQLLYARVSKLSFLLHPVVSLFGSNISISYADKLLMWALSIYTSMPKTGTVHKCVSVSS